MTVRLRYKVWLENEAGRPIVGQGRLRIFRTIRRAGSILKASRILGLPYRIVWAKVKDAERQCGFKIVETSRKGSRLTPEGERLLEKYAELERSCKRSAQAKFRKVFSSSGPNSEEAETQGVPSKGGSDD